MRKFHVKFQQCIAVYMCAANSCSIRFLVKASKMEAMTQH